MIRYLALEELEQRYTRMMNKSIVKHLQKAGGSFMYYYPVNREYESIRVGEFLDVNLTCEFKSRQLNMIACDFAAGAIQDGDIFLVGDVFFPGIEMIRYMAELQNISVKVYAFNYAGRADVNDFVQRLGKWSDLSEHGYHLVCDKVFVGSHYHQKQVMKYFGLDNIKMTGLIWDTEFVSAYQPPVKPKLDYTIWPHRICLEKGIDDFLAYAKMTDSEIIITSSGTRKKWPVEEYGELPKNVRFLGGLSKAEYYSIMSRAKRYLSTALQETFGYTLQEAMYYGCQIVVPDRACYPEMVPSNCRYSNIREIDEIYSREGEALVMPQAVTFRFDQNAGEIIKWILEQQ